MKHTRGALRGAVSFSLDAYAGVVFDLDGVLVRMTEAIPGAVEAVRALDRAGVPFAVATNNSSRTPRHVSDALAGLGFPVRVEQVVTSSPAAAALIAPGARCLVIGEAGLREALADRGCVEVTDPHEAEVVVVGWDQGLTWDDLRRATLALHRGARFVATNTDAGYPSPEGPWPGNGATVAALSTASGRQPEVAGKPHAPLLLAAAARLPEGRLLMVGDRPETDLAGAAALGWDTALVLTGVTAASAVAEVRPRPTVVLRDLGDLIA